ncbi:translation initiation factor IF-2 subunit gamma [Candidatus Pacearchaeota archaeon]|nr:translation initiation factor IF-2 subunit gamma [Candidatus Pacearchaeota archaeon]
MEQIDIEKLPAINVGIFGHIDHGKTTLVKQLTGKWTDTHSEELKRGITIKLGYADLIIRKDGNKYNREKGAPIRYASIIDVPGHEMLMVTMLSGAAITDCAILVIAANEGIKPQTREHLIALQTKKIQNIIVVQNKIDLVTKEQAIKNYQEIREFLKGGIAENAPIIPVSAQQGINIDLIYEQLANVPVPKRDKESKPMFVIARSFDINKPGTNVDDLKGAVLGGTLKKGIIKEGNEIEIKPGLMIKKGNQSEYKTIRTKISSIYKGNYKIKEASPGGSLAFQTELDPSLGQADNLSGNISGLKETLPDITKIITIKFNLFKEVIGMQEKRNVEPIKLGETLLLSINTGITVGSIKRIKDGEMDVTLKIPVVNLKGENVGIARNIQGHWRLVGYGELI